MVKAGAGRRSRSAGLRPGGGSRWYRWRRPANSRKSSVLAKLFPTQTRRPVRETKALCGVPGLLLEGRGASKGW